MDGIRITAAEALTDAQRDAVIAPLGRFSEGRGFPFRPEAVALVLTRGEAVLGGLIGATNWDWLHIEILSVAEALRGTGWGRRLVEEAESIARARGCAGAWVDTFSFQSPGFYRRLGYEVFGELPHYPGAESRLFLRKLFG
ncbi:MAG TPA: GNAT family N-acetyltransferase [Azospirillaceae bacterium]|nr:GNAT family N-acetyltransferase [Azospirillaceae bacterium]